MGYRTLELTADDRHAAGPGTGEWNLLMRQPPQVDADYNGIGGVIGREAASIPVLATRHGRAGVIGAIAPPRREPSPARGNGGLC